MDQSQIQTLLEAICPNVYFQPPTNTEITYPCIIFSRDDAHTDYADNKPYRHKKRYLVTIIDRNPNTPFYDAIAALPSSAFNRFYVADNLNHDVFNVYF